MELIQATFDDFFHIIAVGAGEMKTRKDRIKFWLINNDEELWSYILTNNWPDHALIDLCHSEQVFVENKQ